MSRSMNMLRTRRRDNNVKPNRRLDKKSSRGMLYENEELRLKTININAEIERGQSDIKKLKRENEMLKKEIWCLRDEYDKLDKLVKDKKIDFSSSSTTCSSSSSEEVPKLRRLPDKFCIFDSFAFFNFWESCSSCTEESEEVETSQNIQNVQKTNLKNLRDQFDHLSVVTEETSCENSDRNSKHSIQHENQENLMWNYNEKDIIKPDQSYPTFQDLGVCKSQTLPSPMPPNFFCPIQTSKSFDNNFPRADETYGPESYPPQQEISEEILLDSNLPNQEIPADDLEESANLLSKKIVRTNATNFYQNMVLVPKSTRPPTELTSMEKKASDLIVKIDNQNFNNSLTYSNTTPTTTFSNNGTNLEELLNDIESLSQRGVNRMNQNQDVQSPYSDHPMVDRLISENIPKVVDKTTDDKTHKSELSVVLMPKAMPLIGFEKYKQMQRFSRSFESLHSRNLEEMSASQQNLVVIPPNEETGQNVPPQIVVQSAPLLPETNPFFFGNMKDNYVNADYFSMRYDPSNIAKEETKKPEPGVNAKNGGSKTNLLELTSNSEHVSSENEENLKFGVSKQGTSTDKLKTIKKDATPQKSPKLSIRRKVSIHFKGKKEKERLKKLAESSTPESKTTSPQDKKHSIFDIRFSGENKEKTKNLEKQGKCSHQKTPSIESRKSTTETSNFEPKTPTSSDSKTSDKKGDPKKDGEKSRNRKSSSVSPERNKHVHVKDEGSPKKHKKHKKTERSGRSRRPSTDARMFRERSFSVCTDKSNILDSKIAYGFSANCLYEDYSDRERTNSLSSCDTGLEQRKMSTMSSVPLNGKVPWCGCWGNGCL